MLLQVENLHKKFGAFTALKDVSFSLSPGEVLGLIGPNGSGKTTCINLICGVYRSDGGEILFKDNHIENLPSYQRSRNGISRTFQVPKPFVSLTVRENVAIAVRYGAGSTDEQRVDEVLQLVGLDSVHDRSSRDLTTIQQKQLDLGRAIATNATLICVDELGAGLSESELRDLAGVLKKLASTGIGLIVVEHLMGFVKQVTDRVVVLSEGKDIFSGTLADAVEDAQVVEVFLGAS